MGELEVHSTLKLTTEFGVSEIQLCFGDLTTLPVKDKMDILMVSAFPGDYAPVSGTVIGALHRKLGIDLRDLSYQKEMDMRKHFSCWLTHTLPDWCPYGRILCFERKWRSDSSIVDLIRQMFRVFVPVLRGQETTVITPLLATGNQGHSKTKVLDVMMESGASWILAGLPMTCLKIVVYQYERSVLDNFNSIKESLEKRCQKKSKSLMCIYDIFIMHDPADKDHVNQIEKTFQAEKKGVKIYKDIPHFDKDKVWQDDLYRKMVTSERIVAVLTQSYVDNQECLEMFNMAICCIRGHNKKMLCPFYLDTVRSMPLYMSIIQYYDCRIRKEGDDMKVKVKEACKTVLTKEIKSSVESASNQAHKYDVFISYSHKNPDQAKELLQRFETECPDMRVFYDRSELTTGSMWQTSLYESLNSAKFIFALMSPTYLTSTICQEEYNIAMARYMNQPDKVIFLPVCVEDMASVPYAFSLIQMLDGRGQKFGKVIRGLVRAAKMWIMLKTRDSEIVPELRVEPYNFKIGSEQRAKLVRELYTVDPKDKILARKSPIIIKNKEESCKIAISVSRDKVYCAVFLANFIRAKLPQSKICFLVDENPTGLQELEAADSIIILLSQDYLESATHKNELHLAILKQRANMDKKVLYVCMTGELHECPMFVKLLHYDVHLTDPVWSEFKSKGLFPTRKVMLSKLKSFEGSFSYDPYEYAALTKLLDDVIEGFQSNQKPKDGRVIQSLVRLQLMADPKGRAWLDTTVSTEQCIHPETRDSYATNHLLDEIQRSGDSTEGQEEGVDENGRNISSKGEDKNNKDSPVSTKTKETKGGAPVSIKTEKSEGGALVSGKVTDSEKGSTIGNAKVGDGSVSNVKEKDMRKAEVSVNGDTGGSVSGKAKDKILKDSGAEKAENESISGKGKENGEGSKQSKSCTVL